MIRLNESAVKHTAQAYLCAEGDSCNSAASCGSSCGAGEEKSEPKLAASCGSSCGSGEK